MNLTNQSKIASTISFLVIIYVILIALWVISWLSVGDATWWLILLNRLVPYFFVPVPVLLTVALFTHRFKLILLLVIPTLIFGLLYYPYLLPKLAQTKSNEADLSVMTYNVLFSNLEYDAVANVILTHRPDLVALQEVQPEMMTALQERLETEYPYSLIGFMNQYGTTAVFSRHPVTSSYVLDLKVDRPAVVIKTEIKDREVTFIAAHLLAYGLWWVAWEDVPGVVVERTADQNRQAQLLIDEVKKQNGVAIIGCDCNSKETSSSYRILAKVMKSTTRQVGWIINGVELANAKRDTDLQHIDYVFYRGELNPISVYTIQDSGGSDHLPVLARYSFN